MLHSSPGLGKSANTLTSSKHDFKWVVGYWTAKQKEPWLLMTDLNDWNNEIVRLYGKRVKSKELVSPARNLVYGNSACPTGGEACSSPEKVCKAKKTSGPPGATLNGPGGNLFFRKLVLIAVKKRLSGRSEGEIGLS